MTINISPKEARGIINELKSGNTPFGSAFYLDVGRERWYRGMEYYFECTEDGDSNVRFVRGTYGDGKTHLLDMAQHRALERGFVVSYISAEQTRLDKIEEVYKNVVKNLRTKKIQGGFEFLLEDWRKNASIEAELKRLRSSSEASGLDINFRSAIEAYLCEKAHSL